MPISNAHIPGLRMLLQASQYAAELGRDRWDFAVEIASLRRVGLTNSDLRWLLCKGFVEHAVEAKASDEDRRSFRHVGQLKLRDDVCFVLTDVGAKAVASLPRMRRLRPKRPTWDRSARVLFLGGLIVKQFRVPAVNQVAILDAFEEERWPDRIDDPLPPDDDVDAHERLHDAIKHLNHHQRLPLVRFLGDGTGCGVRWSLAAGRPRRELPQIVPRASLWR